MAREAKGGINFAMVGEGKTSSGNSAVPVHKCPRESQAESPPQLLSARRTPSPEAEE